MKKLSSILLLITMVVAVGNAQLFNKARNPTPKRPSIYVNMANRMILTTIHLQAIKPDDITAIYARGDTAYYVLKTGVWEKADSIYWARRAVLDKK